MSKYLKRERSHEDPENAPIPKKAKLNNCNTSIFDDEEDHRQFVLYLTSIQSAPLHRILQVPSAINQTIAEYSVGELKPCANASCNQSICVLNSDLTEMSFDVSDNRKWKYCHQKDKYFCDSCSIQCALFPCCMTVQCLSESERCYGAWCLNQLGLNEHFERKSVMCTIMGTEEEVCLQYRCKYKCDVDGSVCSETKCGKYMCDYHESVTSYFCARGKHRLCCIWPPVPDCSICKRQSCFECEEYCDFCDGCGECICADCLEEAPFVQCVCPMATDEQCCGYGGIGRRFCGSCIESIEEEMKESPIWNELCRYCDSMVCKKCKFGLWSKTANDESEAVGFVGDWSALHCLHKKTSLALVD
eukprot:353295_1